MALPSLESDWKSLRAKTIQRGWKPLPLQPYFEWLRMLGQPGQPRVMPVLGPSKPHRGLTYQSLGNALADPGDVFYGVTAARPLLDNLITNTNTVFGPYGLAWELVTTHSLTVEYPLRDHVDQDAIAGSVFRLLWEMRFLLQEQPDGQAALDWLVTFRRWMFADDMFEEDYARLDYAGVTNRPATFEERINILAILFGLAFQNGVYDRAVIILDAVDAQDFPYEEALDIVHALEAWSQHTRLPIGILAGFDLENAAEMMRASPRFAGVVLG